MGLWETKLVFGGVAEGKQVDRDATFDIGKNVNYRRHHDRATLNRKLSKDSGLAIDAKVHWIKDLQGTKYAYCANGKIFERKAAASWVSVKTVSNSTGQGLGVDASYLYYTNASYVGRFPAGGTWGVDNSDTWQGIVASSWNPIKYFAAVDLLLIASGENLAVYDYGAANFSSSRLVMPKGWDIRDLEEWSDYMAVSCWTGANIRSSSEGKMILWDGLNDTFSAIVDSEQGNILLTQKDGYHLNVFAGVIGNISRYESGQFNQKRKIPYINEDAGEWIDVFPGAKTLWKGIPHFGVSGDGSAASMMRGVYSWGTNRNNVPNSLNLEYAISTGTTGTNADVTALHTAADNELYVGWEDDGSFGIDKLDTSNEADDGFIETVEFHGSRREEGYTKRLKHCRLLFEPLASGQKFTLKVKADGSASWATVVTAETPSSVEINARILASDMGNLPVGRYFQQRIEWTSADGSAPTFISSRVRYDVRPSS